MRTYVEQTWGWDEEWQWKYHQEDFNPAIMQILECDGIAFGILELSQEISVDNVFFVVSGIYIIDKFQSKGIGRDIIKSIISKADAENKNIKLKVLKVNKRDKEFYLKLGFIETGENETHSQMIYNKKNLENK